MALRVIAYDDTNERLVRTDKDPADILSGSSTGGAIPDEIAAGSETLTNGLTYIEVSFTNALSSATYALVLNFTNVVDSLSFFQPITVTEKTASGFKCVWTAPLDSNNYKLDYLGIIPCSSFRADSFDLAYENGASTGLKSFLSANTFATVGQLGQPNGGGPASGALIQTPVNTTVSATQYEASWTTFIESSTYNFDYVALSSTCPTLKSGVEILTTGTTQQLISFAFPALASADFSLVARFTNTADSNILYQPVTVTSKSLSGFTAKWNMPLDNGNYSLNWVLHVNN